MDIVLWNAFVTFITLIWAFLRLADSVWSWSDLSVWLGLEQTPEILQVPEVQTHHCVCMRPVQVYRASRPMTAEIGTLSWSLRGKAVRTMDVCGIKWFKTCFNLFLCIDCKLSKYGLICVINHECFSARVHSRRLRTTNVVECVEGRGLLCGVMPPHI